MPASTDRTVFAPAAPPGALAGSQPSSDGAAPSGEPQNGASSVRPRGRPFEMSSGAVLEKIRQLAGRKAGLFRIHQTHSALYARARRLFGSWALAVSSAGVNYTHAIESARTRSLDTRRRLRRRRRAPR